jgi:hypothetical protein
MYLVTYYEAEDGTRFDTEEECIEYEKQCSIESLGSDAIMLNFAGKPTDDISAVEFLIVKTDEAARKVQAIFDMNEIVAPFDEMAPKAGYYLYDSDSWSWTSLEDYIEHLNDLWAFFFGHPLIDIKPQENALPQYIPREETADMNELVETDFI